MKSVNMTTNEAVRMPENTEFDLDLIDSDLDDFGDGSFLKLSECTRCI